MAILKSVRAYIGQAIPKHRFLQFLYSRYLSLLAFRKKLFKKKHTIKYAGKTVQFKELNYDEYFDRLKEFLLMVRDMPEEKPFIVMFSGTIYMQEERANRPIRLSKIYLDSGIPVLFSYFRWNKKDEVPGNFTDLLFQSPIDFTLKAMNYLVQFDFKKRTKIFIVSFPYLEITKFINQMNLNNWTTIYDARDDWEEFGKVGMAKWYDKSAEHYIINNCDLSFSISNPLKDKLQLASKSRKVYLSPNAYDTTFLKVNPDKSLKNPDDKIAGYFGHLTDRWFDWDALRFIALNCPDWKFEIIGHGEPTDLELPANVILLGKRNHQDINKIASRWNVAMILFKINKLSAAVDPIKIYEYLALELPTVSFVMPQIHDYPYAYIAETPEEFVIKLNEALHADIEHDIIWDFLSVNKWEDRAEQFLQAAENLDKKSLSFTQLLLS